MYTYNMRLPTNIPANHPHDDPKSHSILADAIAAFLLHQLACVGELMGFRGNTEHFRMAFLPQPTHPI